MGVRESQVHSFQEDTAVPVPANPDPIERVDEPSYDISTIIVPFEQEGAFIQESVWPEYSPEQMPYYRPEWYEEQEKEQEKPAGSHVIVLDIFGRDS